jgi:hypothetical protein
MFNIFPSQRKIVAQCERKTPVFWIMHEIENTPEWVQVDFLDRDNEVLQSEKMPYSSPTQREATLKRIEKIRQEWIFKIC